MNIAAAIRGLFAARSNSPTDPLWGPGLIGPTASGVTVTPDTAMRCAAVFACVRVLAETIASLPILIYQRASDGGKSPYSAHPLYSLLHDSPGDGLNLTAYEFKELMVTHLCLRGNFYAFKETTRGGRIIRLAPLNPARMRVERDAEGTITYIYQRPLGGEETYTTEEVWHVKAISTDGLIGLSPITVAREAVGLAIAMEDHGARFFSQGARPGLILRHPGRLSEDAATRLKESWQRAHAGSGGAHKTALLEEGIEIATVGFSNEDAQFLEARDFQIGDIARLFRVPAVLIGHNDATSTYASAEQFFLSFATHTIRPWVLRLEQSINANLLPAFDRDKFFAEFKMDALLRGDTQSRFSAYAIARQNRWLSVNEIRRLENMNPIPGGDTYENPNITPGGGEGDDG